MTRKRMPQVTSRELTPVTWAENCNVWSGATTVVLGVMEIEMSLVPGSRLVGSVCPQLMASTACVISKTTSHNLLLSFISTCAPNGQNSHRSKNTNTQDYRPA
jgi:hypothetical protein